MQYVPNNVTRIGDLPTVQYLYLGFAPWFSAACTTSYLAAAREVPGLDGLVFYTPNNSTGTPPPISDGTWDLNDGGQWKSQNKYPVYAVPGVDGEIIMQQLAQYSGKVSNAKAQSILTQEQLDPTDYVRLYTNLGLDGGTSLPTLWAFLLIVLGVVLLVIGLTVRHFSEFFLFVRTAFQIADIFQEQTRLATFSLLNSVLCSKF